MCINAEGGQHQEFLQMLNTFRSVFYLLIINLLVKHWRRKWQPTPVFLPRGSRGQRSLVGCCPSGRTESDMTEAT